MNCCLETDEELEYRTNLIMQGTDNFVRTYKQKNKDVRVDKKRLKTSDKSQARKERKLKEKEIEE